MARRHHISRRRSRGGGKIKGIMGMGPIVIIIGIIFLAIAAYFVMKKLKGSGGGAAPMPSLDTIVANQQKAVQQAHAARLVSPGGCSSCGGR